MKHAAQVLTVLVGVASCPLAAWATPVQWSSNGHWYDVVNETLTWEAAREGALGSVYQARRGHLATLTSEEENAFVTAQLGGLLSTEAWLGGSQPAWASEPSESWAWCTGETWSYTHWRTGGSSDEPNNGMGLYDEDALTMNWGPNAGTWNDSRNYVTFPYLVEYEGEAIPEPSSLVLVLAGTLGLLAWRRAVSSRPSARPGCG
jgi:hypothetical protein